MGPEVSGLDSPVELSALFPASSPPSSEDGEVTITAAAAMIRCLNVSKDFGRFNRLFGARDEFSLQSRYLEVVFFVSEDINGPRFFDSLLGNEG